MYHENSLQNMRADLKSWSSVAKLQNTFDHKCELNTSCIIEEENESKPPAPVSNILKTMIMEQWKHLNKRFTCD